MAKLKIVPSPKPSCNQCIGQNTTYNLKPGDYYVEEEAGEKRSCIVCYSKNNTLVKRKSILKKIKSDKGLKHKRAMVLIDWEETRKKILQMVSRQYKRREYDEAIAKIEYDCQHKTWEERHKEVEAYVTGDKNAE